MTVQYSTAVRNAIADAVENTIGTAPTLEIRTGAPPATPATADSGTLLASMVLPSDWLTAASGGVKTLVGTWQDTSADAAGTAGHYRIKQGATCHEQGTVTATGGGGDITLDNTSIAVAQSVTITAKTYTAGGA